MSPFKDFTELVEPLRLPINGKLYTIPAVNIADGVRMRLVLDGTVKEQPSEDELIRIFLGAAADEMEADGVPLIARKRAFYTAVADFQRGRDTAELMWETGADPKAIERWTAANTPPPPESTGKDEATTTPQPASTSSTKNSRRRPKAEPKKTG